MQLRLSAFLLTMGCLFSFAPTVMANEFQCEILNLKGTVTVRDSKGTAHPAKQAELLKAGDEVEVGSESYADLAYDKDWKNVARLEADSKAKITSIAPGKLDLSQGGVFAKLRKLPQDSTFEVKTPTAVATVRGSEYRTTFILGQTDVFNAASSRIVVYGMKEDGSVDKESAVMIEKDKKTSVETAGKAPKAAEPMSEGEIKTGKSLRGGIETNVKKAEKDGRSANIQSVTEIEKYIREEKKKAILAATPAKSDELSRVTDMRRRPFGGDREMAPPPREEESEQAPTTEESPSDKNV